MPDFSLTPKGKRYYDSMFEDDFEHTDLTDELYDVLFWFTLAYFENRDLSQEEIIGRFTGEVRGQYKHLTPRMFIDGYKGSKKFYGMFLQSDEDDRSDRMEQDVASTPKQITEDVAKLKRILKYLFEFRLIKYSHEEC